MKSCNKQTNEQHSWSSRKKLIIDICLMNFIMRRKTHDIIIEDRFFETFFIQIWVRGWSSSCRMRSSPYPLIFVPKVLVHCSLMYIWFIWYEVLLQVAVWVKHRLQSAIVLWLFLQSWIFLNKKFASPFPTNYQVLEIRVGWNHTSTMVRIWCR